MGNLTTHNVVDCRAFCVFRLWLLTMAYSSRPCVNCKKPFAIGFENISKISASRQKHVTEMQQNESKLLRGVQNIINKYADFTRTAFSIFPYSFSTCDLYYLHTLWCSGVCNMFELRGPTFAFCYW